MLKPTAFGMGKNHRRRLRPRADGVFEQPVEGPAALHRVADERQGCKVGLIARRGELLTELATEITAKGGVVAHAAADVAERAPTRL